MPRISVGHFYILCLLVWNTLKDWAQGGFGKVIVGGLMLVGIIRGIGNQSLMTFAVCIGGALGLYNAPFIIESVMSATLVYSPGIALQFIQLSNGLSI